MIMNLVSDCIFVIYLVLLKKNTHFVSVFFVCTELMGLIEDRFPGKFVEFAESNFKFCFPNPAPVERLNVWNNVKLTGMSMTEYFQDAQVEIQDCDDDEEKVLFFRPQDIELNNGALWNPEEEYHFARLTLKSVWKENDIELFQAHKIRFGVRRFTVMERVKELHYDQDTKEWISSKSFSSCFHCNNIGRIGTSCTECESDDGFHMG